MVVLENAVQHVAGVQQLHQFAGAVQGGQAVVGVQALLIPGGGIGAHALVPGGDPDGSAVEAGGLKDDGGGVVHNAAVLAAHDAGNGYGLLGVSDNQLLAGEGAVHAVQGSDGLAVLGQAHADLALFDVAQVKGMHGLAVFQHHIVGDVHDVVDGPHTQSAQTLPHPAGRGFHPDVFHNPGTVDGAQGGFFHLYVQHPFAGTVAGFHLRGVELQRLMEGGGCLPGQADDGEAVRAVGGNLKLHTGVVQADGLADGFAQGQVTAVFLSEDENAVLHRRGEVVGGKVQLAQRAEHTVALHAPELALFNLHAAGQSGIVQGCRHHVAGLQVLGAGDNLDILAAAHVHLADPQVVGVGVTLHGFHPGHHHIADFAALDFIAFHLGAAHGNRFGKAPHGHFIQGDKVFQPFHRKIHLMIHQAFLF